MSKIKKLLLIVGLTLCIFQMIVLAIAIDIGDAAVDRPNAPTGYTLIGTNSSNSTGTITSIEVWVNTNVTGLEVAIFTQGEANVFTTRDSVTLGTVTAGEYSVSNGNPIIVDSETNPISLDVVEGDFIGLYPATGTIDTTEGGEIGTGWYKFGDEISCTDVTFTAALIETSLHGIGATTTSVMFTLGDF